MVLNVLGMFWGGVTSVSMAAHVCLTSNQAVEKLFFSTKKYYAQSETGVNDGNHNQTAKFRYLTFHCLKSSYYWLLDLTEYLCL